MLLITQNDTSFSLLHFNIGRVAQLLCCQGGGGASTDFGQLLPGKHTCRDAKQLPIYSLLFIKVDRIPCIVTVGSPSASADVRDT